MSLQDTANMSFRLSSLAVIRSRREMFIKVCVATLGIVAATDAVDAVINLYTQPDRLWPSLVQTTFTAAAMSALFLSALAHANLKLFQLKESLHTLAMTDVQTGLLNRRGFFEALGRSPDAMADATLLVLDIDHFKRINDGYGHLAGDYVIAEVGRTLRERLTAPHVTGRIGGEEFAAALFGLSALEAHRHAEMLRRDISRISSERMPKHVKVTVSIGMARMGEHPVMEAFSAADKALYRAKDEGRNRCVGADDLGGSNIVPMPVVPRLS